MAIKVNNTTVIDNSRSLTNIASLDAATVTTLENNLVVPTVNGTTGQVLTSNGTATPIWADAGGGFAPTTVSGTSQSLNLGSFNFFDAGTLTADTTISFTSVPTEANWKYSFVPGILSGYNLASGSYTGDQFATAAQTTLPVSIAFKPDGTEMYITGENNPASVYQYSLAVPWKITTASYTASFNVSTQAASPYGIAFKSDGTAMYIMNFQAVVYQYTLSTAWDVSTASYASISKSVAAQYANQLSLDFKSDGTVMYTLDTNGSVHQYNLSTAWNVGTASYASISYSVKSQDSNPGEMRISSDGTKLLYLGMNTDRVYSYTLSTAYNVSTASLDADSLVLSGQGVTSTYGMFVSSDGVHLYVVNSAAIDSVLYYLIADLTSVTLPASVENTPDVLRLNNRTTYEFYTTDGGTTVTLIGEEVQ